MPLGIISGHIVEALEEFGPLTIEQLEQAVGVPAPHLRAALSELCFNDRLVSSDGKHFILEPPPESW